MKISGNFTWSTPTTAFSPLQISRIAITRRSCRWLCTRLGTQKTGAMTAK
jgi:hypothetical protein